MDYLIDFIFCYVKFLFMNLFLMFIIKLYFFCYFVKWLLNQLIYMFKLFLMFIISFYVNFFFL